MTKNEINLGDVINDCEVINTYLDNKNNLAVIAKCNKCGLELKIPSYKFRRGHFMCKHGERRSANYYIGKDVGNLHINSLVGVDETNRTIVNIVCKDCGKSKDVLLHRVTSFSYICDCEKLDNYEKIMLNKYKQYIGQTKLSDTIIDVIYRPEANVGSNRTKFILQCDNCGLKREVGVLQFLDSIDYKKCNCKPKTREVLDPMKKYRQTMLGKKYGSLKIIDFEDGTKLQNIVAICKCDCGNESFSTLLSNIVSGDTRSCGCKCRSNASIIIEKTLRKLNVKFTMEQKMTDLFSVKGRPLKFDFFIMDKNNIGRAVIEYDGPHHNTPFDYGNTWDDEEIQRKFKTIQQNDKIKDDYVKSHGCIMYRLKYNYKHTEKDIENLITDFILSNKLNQI